jgi:cell division protein FtsB
VARPRRRGGADGLSQLLSETQELVAQLVKENKALKSRNLKLARELDRLSTGWEQIKKVARSAPRRRR